MSLRRFITNRCTAFDPTAVDLEAEAAYRILAAHRRRLVLRQLADLEGERIALPDLARAVAAAETGVAHRDVQPDAYEAAYVALYQSHLPQLEDKGAIEWTPESRMVAATPVAWSLLEIIEFVDARTTES